MSRRFVNLALCLILVACCSPLAAQTYSLQGFRFPNEPHADTIAYGINNRGAIVGYTYVRDTRFRRHGDEAFKRDADGVFERPLDQSNAPVVTGSIATGINDHGVISGFYFSPSTSSAGFLLSQGVFTSFSVTPGDFTQILGINNKGDFVGLFAADNSSPSHAFISVDGAVTPIFPNTEYAIDWGIAADDTSVVYLITKKNGGQALIRDSSGQYKTFQIPGAAITSANGINNAAHKIVGYYFTQSKKDVYHEHGFVYDYITGVVTTIDWPDRLTTQTVVTGVNSQGVIVGYVSVRFQRMFSFIGTPQ